jgi:phospholipid/cholesterol/gamma-HCH transport system substrate-binding protein
LLTNLNKRQLIIFGVVTAVAVLVLGWHYLRLPSLAGIGRYTLNADLPASGGLYATSNVTYRGITIGKVTAIVPTERGARATMSIDDRYKIPIDATANVHSVSAVGEQYLDLVSVDVPEQYFTNGQTITKTTVPSDIGPALDAANRGLSALPKEKISSLLEETALAIGGLGPALQRLVDSTQAVVGDFKTNISDVNDLIQNTTPILESQVDSGDAIGRWARYLNNLGDQAAQTDGRLKSVLSQAAPTAKDVNAVFDDVHETLPATLANLAIVADMLKRYHKGVEQVLVVLPQAVAVGETVLAGHPGKATLDLAVGVVPGVPIFPPPLLVPGLSVNYPPPCLTGYLPASQWRSFADTSPAELPAGMYCKIPQDTPANNVRGVRNLPCVDVPGKRAPTPRDCRSDKPYIPLGTNPWYGDPNQIRNCPAPGARCDQPVDPGRVIPAPSVNTGLNPLPADLLPGTPPPVSDPLSRPRSGTVECNGQQPNPCIYTPGEGAAAIYNPQSGEVAGPDGVTYSVEDSSAAGDDGWKEMLAPAANSPHQ